MEETMSGWVRALKEKGLDDLARRLHSDKFEDVSWLMSSGLPILDHFKVPFDEFSEDNPQVTAFLEKYDGVVIRAVPNSDRLPRTYVVNVRTFQECWDFLRNAVEPGQEENYHALLTEYFPEKLVGSIISNPEKTLIEISRGNITDFSHGKYSNFELSHGIFQHHNHNHFKSMRYSTEDIEKRKVMWWVLQFIREKDLPSDSDLFSNVRFKPGYFEFIVGQKPCTIKFLDYKVNQSYMKL